MYGWCGTVVKSLGFSPAKEGMNVFVLVVGKGLRKRQEAEGVVSGLFIIFGLEEHCGKKKYHHSITVQVRYYYSIGTIGLTHPIHFTTVDAVRRRMHWLDREALNER